MIRSLIAALCLALVAVSPVFAISPGDDLLIAGAARTDRWTSDLYINNPGATTVTVTVAWLVRGQANPNPETATFDVGPDETLILEDFILETFGQPRADGAVRITDAIDFMRTGQFLENEIRQGESYVFTVNVPSGASSLKVTLAWDDAPATPNVNPALVNNLDLVVTSPSMRRPSRWSRSVSSAVGRSVSQTISLAIIES